MFVCPILDIPQFMSYRVGNLLYCHGPLKLWIIAGGGANN